MSKKTRGRRPGPKTMRLVGADEPPKPPPAPAPVDRRDVPAELHLRDPIPGLDGKPIHVLVEGQGLDWSMVSFVAQADEKRGTLVPAYQVRMFEEDGVGWLVTVPVSNVIASRTPVRRAPPKPPEPVP